MRRLQEEEGAEGDPLIRKSCKGKGSFQKRFGINPIVIITHHHLSKYSNQASKSFIPTLDSAC